MAYKRGAIVDHLLQQMLTAPGDSDKMRIRQLYSCRLIVFFSENEAVAKYCVKERERARPVAEALLDAQAYLLHMIPGQLRETKPVQDSELLVKREKGKGRYEFLDLALENIKGFANFFRASKHFRQALQQSETFFPDLESLVSRNITKRASAHLQEKAAKHVSRLLHIFSQFEDCQHWTIDSGRLRIHAAAARLLRLDGVTEGFVKGWKKLGGPSSAGSVPLATSWQLRKHLESSEKKLLYFDRRIRNAGDPHTARKLRQEWLDMNEGALATMGWPALERCGGLPSVAQGPEQDGLRFAKAVARAGSSAAPVVCSWEMCTEGSVLDAGRQFSKCANCSLAFYCSKEHQKLHWTSHKKQCKAETSD
ncbi:hypothetical protein KFL_006620080 [Klebsormidium nitens]|uniref:MYND-type domain-containing protein n=1 Tax=Klebsormidium nitens TaxID=105231 RepID=A0A1Y1IIS9_KLENI|nr:hypothetical protein KFL_006620080 [Klebsormidium nitens]|eukprot:GAQ90613.1 hypothetical protein KFL_006620080 [Klebsormidium nitens]